MQSNTTLLARTKVHIPLNSLLNKVCQHCMRNGGNAIFENGIYLIRSIGRFCVTCLMR